jgi:hypothetical protein
MEGCLGGGVIGVEWKSLGMQGSVAIVPSRKVTSELGERVFSLRSALAVVGEYGQHLVNTKTKNVSNLLTAVY